METTPAPLPGSSPDEMFPVLTPEQQARVLAHGRLREAESGETIVEPSTPGRKFFVVVSGRLELQRVSDNKEELIALCRPGMFTGELSLLSGRRALVRIRAGEASKLIEIEREALRDLVQTDSELSDIFLRAFHPATLGINRSRDWGLSSNWFKSLARYLPYQRVPYSELSALYVHRSRE